MTHPRPLPAKGGGGEGGRGRGRPKPGTKNRLPAFRMNSPPTSLCEGGRGRRGEREKPISVPETPFIRMQDHNHKHSYDLFVILINLRVEVF